VAGRFARRRDELREALRGRGSHAVNEPARAGADAPQGRGPPHQVIFAAASHSGTTAVSLGAGALLVIYPLIDAFASLLDARSQHGSARQLLLLNAASSTVAAIALGVAATGNAAAVFAVFGVWAAVSGAAQLVVALRRRAQLGNQWPLLLANGVSVIGGTAFIAAAGAHPKLSMLAIYAATGGIEFVIQAGLLARRQRRPANTAARS
jgi:uncharacterized membrane protein HdeD (DUF308 family)